MRRVGHQGKPDGNTAGIVEQLREYADISVTYVGKPLDLVIGYGGLNFFIEIKNPNGKDERGPPYERQLAFMDKWQGQCAFAHSAEEVLEIIGYRFDG